MKIDGWKGETEVVKLQLDGRTVMRLCPRVVRTFDDEDYPEATCLIYTACLDMVYDPEGPPNFASWISGIWSQEWVKRGPLYVIHDVYIDRIEDADEYEAMLPLLRSGAFLAPEVAE